MDTKQKYLIEVVKDEKSVQMDVVGYDPIESNLEEIIVESTEIQNDIHDCSGLNSYCCQEYFESFDALFQHMQVTHLGTLRKCLGMYQDTVKKCIEEYESMQVVDEELWEAEVLEAVSDTEMEQTSKEKTQDTGEVFYVSKKIIDTVRTPLKAKSQDNNEISYECQTCNKICVGSNELQKHERKHLAPLICYYCNEYFRTRTQLKRHIFKHTAEEMGNSDMNCAFCEMLFANEEQVKAHRIEFHTRSDVSYACESCDKSFSIKFDLTKHIQNCHSEKKKLSCKYCYKKIPDEETLEHHLLQHENEEASLCPHCHKPFKGKKVLRHHIAYYHTQSGYASAHKNRNLHCSICGKGFIYPNQVKNHEINIHGVGEAAFFCSVCQKGFAKQWDLQNHELMHSNDKPFKCLECPKDFRRASHLKSHMFNVHTPSTEKPDVRCLICQKPFKNVEALRKHIRKVHDMSMNDMYKQMGLPYKGRDIMSSKRTVDMTSSEKIQVEEGTVEIEIVGL